MFDRSKIKNLHWITNLKMYNHFQDSFLNEDKLNAIKQI